MILEGKTQEEFGKSFDDIAISKEVWLKCDYCGIEFKRIKKSVVRSWKNLKKDCCPSMACIDKKRQDVNLFLFGDAYYFKTDKFKNKAKETNLEKFGHEFASQCQEVKDKTKQTFIEKYNVSNPLQLEEVREKHKKTCLERYGVDNYAKTEEFLQKMKETNLEKYGCEFVSQSQEIKDKSKQTCLEKYGKEAYTQTEEYWKNRKQTCLEKYGVEHPHQNKEIYDKFKQTMVERFGVEHFAQTEEYKNKLEQYEEQKKATNLERFDVDYYPRSVEYKDRYNEFQDKRKKTNLSKYGNENYHQSSHYREQVNDILNKVRQTCKKRFGTEHYTQSSEYKLKLDDIRKKTIATNLERYGVEYHSKRQEYKDRMKELSLERYGVPYTIYLTKTTRNSKVQQSIQHWLESLGFAFSSDTTILEGKEIDLYNNELKLGIEYCGLYWHNELSRNPRTKDYHYNKYLNCNKKGVRLITIFEDEWKHKNHICKAIISSILGKFEQRIYGRNCEIKELNSNEFGDFCKVNHLRGRSRSSLINYGLFHKEELVAGMSLGRHPRTASITVLDRLCFKNGYQIVGGASKLFKSCLNWAKNNNLNEIISWSDNRWSAGGIYKTLKFELKSELKPDYSYVHILHPSLRVSKQSQKKNSVKCPNDKTEREWCIERGFARIWDCGKKRWIFTIHN